MKGVLTYYPGGLISVTELVRQAKWIRRGVYGRARAPFFAHLDIPMMADFVEQYRARYGRYPSDWAVMSYDGVHALKQGIEKAGSIDTEKVKDAMKGMSIDTTRGRRSFRRINNQLNPSAYFGRVADDPGFPHLFGSRRTQGGKYLASRGGNPRGKGEMKQAGGFFLSSECRNFGKGPSR